jgi:hypothetical protein
MSHPWRPVQLPTSSREGEAPLTRDRINAWRGAMTLQALRTKIGDNAFFQTLKGYQATFREFRGVHPGLCGDRAT